MLLNYIFFVHEAVAAALAFFLFFFAPYFTWLVTGRPWPAGDPGEIGYFFARFAAVGLLLVTITTDFARRSGLTSVRWAAIFAMLALTLAAMLVALFISFPLLMLLTLVFNLIFFAAYLFAMYWRPEEI